MANFRQIVQIIMTGIVSGEDLPKIAIFSILSFITLCIVNEGWVDAITHRIKYPYSSSVRLWNEVGVRIGSTLTDQNWSTMKAHAMERAKRLNRDWYSINIFPVEQEINQNVAELNIQRTITYPSIVCLDMLDMIIVLTT